jgi:hypothetical protein
VSVVLSDAGALQLTHALEKVLSEEPIKTGST